MSECLGGAWGADMTSSKNLGQADEEETKTRRDAKIQSLEKDCWHYLAGERCGQRVGHATYKELDWFMNEAETGPGLREMLLSTPTIEGFALG